MAYDLATVTNSGNQLLASVVSDRSSLVIDKIEVSNTQLASSTDLKSMKSISNVVKTLSANGYQKKDTSFIISTVLDNSSVTADYQAWVFGIWAHEADGGSPILMSVITSTSSPDTISKGSGTPIDYNYKFITTFSNASSLTIKMASDTYATNDTVIHNSGDETATGTKTFQEIKISNDKFPSLVQTDGQYITLDGGNSEIIPADDSKVVHSTITKLNSTDMNTVLTAGFYNSTNGTNGIPSGDNFTIYQVIPLSRMNGVQLAYETNNSISGMRSWNWSSGALNFTSWIQFADDSKVVHSTDMRKPASDVAGIEEVNAKQDKIGYTPADDSKVVHLSGTETVTGDKNFTGALQKGGVTVPSTTDVSTAVNQTALTAGTDVNTLTTDGVYSFSAIALTNFYDTAIHWGFIHVYHQGGLVWQIAVTAPITNGYLVRMENGSPLTWRAWTRVADDSTVAHLSGANNFDTVPTVNNNPLLLASSLPSDLARTGSDQEFTGKNTFDTAPIDKTTGNPYITKDGVPSDVAQTGQAQTFTAAQTFSIAPTIKDASKDKGDNQAATMADLKSVENSAWHDLTTTDVNGSFDVEILYQKIISEKKLRFIFIADYRIDKDLSNYNLAIDLSKIITKFSGPTQYLHVDSDSRDMDYDFNANSGSSLITCSKPINWTKSASALGFATSFLATRTNGVLNDTLYVDGFKA